MNRVTGFAIGLVVAAGAATAALSLSGHNLLNIAGTNAECPQTMTIADSLHTYATGEVAAFVVAEDAIRLPELALLDADKNERSLEHWAGQTILINLWATWCIPCIKEMPDLDRLEAELGSDTFEVVAIALDRMDPEAPAQFYEEHNLTNLALYTDTSNASFRALREKEMAIGLPTSILADGSGCVLGILTGPALWDHADAIALIEAAMGKAEG